MFNQTEGGMDHRVFGKPVATLAEALQQLDVANAVDSPEDWVIVVHTTKKVK